MDVKWISATELAAYLGVSRIWVEKYIKENRIPGQSKVGRLWRFDTDRINTALEAGQLLLNVPDLPPLITDKMTCFFCGPVNFTVNKNGKRYQAKCKNCKAHIKLLGKSEIEKFCKNNGLFHIDDLVPESSKKSAGEKHAFKK